MRQNFHSTIDGRRVADIFIKYLPTNIPTVYTTGILTWFLFFVNIVWINKTAYTSVLKCKSKFHITNLICGTCFYISGKFSE